LAATKRKTPEKETETDTEKETETDTEKETDSVDFDVNKPGAIN